MDAYSVQYAHPLVLVSVKAKLFLLSFPIRMYYGLNCHQPKGALSSIYGSSWCWVASIAYRTYQFKSPRQIDMICVPTSFLRTVWFSKYGFHRIVQGVLIIMCSLVLLGAKTKGREHLFWWLIWSTPCYLTIIGMKWNKQSITWWYIDT